MVLIEDELSGCQRAKWLGWSAITAFVFRQPVSDSHAANFTTQGIVYVIAKHPPR